MSLPTSSGSSSTANDACPHPYLRLCSREIWSKTLFYWNGPALKDLGSSPSSATQFCFLWPQFPHMKNANNTNCLIIALCIHVRTSTNCPMYLTKIKHCVSISKIGNANRFWKLHSTKQTTYYYVCKTYLDTWKRYTKERCIIQLYKCNTTTTHHGARVLALLPIHLTHVEIPK